MIEDIENALATAPQTDAEKEALAEKRRQGAIKAEEKRKREQDERERRIADEAASRATQAAMEAFKLQLAQMQPQSQAVVEKKSASDMLSDDFRTTYSDVANGIAPVLDTVYGESQSLKSEMDALKKQFAAFNGTVAEATTVSKVDDDPDFQDFLNGDTDAGVPRRNALEHWKNTDISRYRQLRTRYVDQFNKERGTTSIDEFAQPSTSQSATVTQAKQSTPAEVVARVGREIEVELAKGPMANHGRIQKLTEARSWFQNGDTAKGLEIIKSLKG